MVCSSYVWQDELGALSTTEGQLLHAIPFLQNKGLPAACHNLSRPIRIGTISFQFEKQMVHTDVHAQSS